MKDGAIFGMIGTLDRKLGMLGGELGKTQMRQNALDKLITKRIVIESVSDNWFCRLMRKLCGLQESKLLCTELLVEARKAELAEFNKAVDEMRAEMSKPKIKVVPGNANIAGTGADGKPH